MSSGWICPSSAFCVFCGQATRVKSAVCGRFGNTVAIGSDCTVASTKRLGCSVQFAAPDVVTVIEKWESVEALYAICSAALLYNTLFDPVDSQEIHFHAASGFLLALNTQLEPSPYVAQPVPFGPRGTGTAEIASPNASTI